MNSACNIYYPYVQIPQETLVHSLLFADKIKRIIPATFSPDKENEEAYFRPSKIIKQALGYEFILDAEYHQSKLEVSEAFSAFLRDANNSKTDTPFKSLLGESYKERFSEIRNRHFGIQHLVFVEKFDHNVFSALEETGWMVYHEDTRACELPQEICDIYMTLLASNISKAQGDLLETNQQYCENIFRNTDFQDYFKELLPQQYSDSKKFKDISINFLFGNNESKDSVPIHKILSIQQASYVRAGLENEREAFSEILERIVKKVKLIETNKKSDLVVLELEELKEQVNEFKRNLDNQIIRNLTEKQKNMRNHWTSGISLTFPILGAAADSLVGTGSPLGLFWSLGIVASLGTFLSQKEYGPKGQPNLNTFSSEREKAFLFINKLWEVQKSRTIA